jgi:hypothetical protein
MKKPDGNGNWKNVFIFLRIVIKTVVHLLLLVVVSFSQPLLADSSSQSIPVLNLHSLRDKIRGGWVGQMVGVSYGFPTEFAYRERIIPENELPTWQADMVSAALEQDDLYVDITLAQVLDDVGLDASSEDFAKAFRETKYPLWHANLSARRALRRGVPAHLSGTPAYNIHANDIDFQIEADFIGLMSPGLPQLSNEISFRAGRVLNHGDGIYGGMFISGMYTAAFFEEETETIVRLGLAVLPEQSDYAKLLSDVLLWWRQSPADWKSVWQKIHDKWNQGEMCPEGIEQPFNIDAKINGAFVALALLYGAGDFEKTMIIATRAGQDSDCNPSSALGILGVVLGYEQIPEKFTNGIDVIADNKFIYTDYSLNEIVESSLTRAILAIERHGGEVKDDKVYFHRQASQPAKLQAWSGHGKVKEQIRFDDVRWQWSGDWASRTMKIWRYEHSAIFSKTKNAQTAIDFKGTGVVLKGILLADGGLADVYLDGEYMRTIDVYPDENIAKPNESLWHKFGLQDIAHTLRVVVLGESYKKSQGANIGISGLIVYQ